MGRADAVGPDRGLAPAPAPVPAWLWRPWPSPWPWPLVPPPGSPRPHSAPLRARQHLNVTACLLTGPSGIALGTSAPRSDGHESASVATHVMVSTCPTPGPPMPGRRSTRWSSGGRGHRRHGSLTAEVSRPLRPIRVTGSFSHPRQARVPPVPLRTRGGPGRPGGRVDRQPSAPWPRTLNPPGPDLVPSSPTSQRPSWSQTCRVTQNPTTPQRGVGSARSRRRSRTVTFVLVVLWSAVLVFAMRSLCRIRGCGSGWLRVRCSVTPRPSAAAPAPRAGQAYYVPVLRPGRAAPRTRRG